jgi:hypothetical protein
MTGLKQGANIFQKSRARLKILGTRSLIRNTLHAKDPKIRHLKEFIHPGDLAQGICETRCNSYL